MENNKILYGFYTKKLACVSFQEIKPEKKSDKIDLDVRLMHFCEGRTELPPTVPSQFLSLLSNLSKYKVIAYKSKSCGELHIIVIATFEMRNMHIWTGTELSSQSIKIY